ncbi:cytochrome P450 10-like [Physella acuta]|uniref:cytochrome P450 10-like n=1 Tax=Physella acuta TaxID=109671 RepID=UPI0027DABD22|nr:cytochrome P450 10-like [Physella acuta]
MAIIRKLVNQSVKQFVSPSVASSKRVVSTSPRVEQGAAAISLESPALQQCPFMKSGSAMADDSTSLQEVTNVQPFSSMPGPKGLPVLGTLLDYFKKDGPRFNKMFDVYRQRALEFGDIYYEKVGHFHSVVVSSPEAYNRLVHAEGKYPHRRPMVPIEYYRKQKGIDLGIVNSQGEPWYKQRTVASKKMLKLSEVTSFSAEMGEVADDFMKRLSSARNAQGEVPAVEREFFKWAMESMGTFLFEERIGCLGAQPTPLAQSFIENMEGFFKKLQPLMYNMPFYKLWATKTWKQFEHYSDNVMDIGRSIVEKKMASMESDNGSKSAFISYLLDSGTMSTKEVTALVIDLMTAAVETTSTAMVWCLYNLAKNPQVQEKIYAEISEAKAANNGSISAEELSRLPLVKAVVKETLRLYPITYATSRNVQEDIELLGYRIPAGTHVQANLYGMYHNPELFPNPEEFLPERWLRGEQMDATIKSTSQLIWGHGARMCIGRRLAEQEMHITLSKIIQNFTLSYNHDDVEPVLNTMMTPDRPVLVQFTPREQH